MVAQVNQSNTLNNKRVHRMGIDVISVFKTILLEKDLSIIWNKENREWLIVNVLPLIPSPSLGVKNWKSIRMNCLCLHQIIHINNLGKVQEKISWRTYPCEYSCHREREGSSPLPVLPIFLGVNFVFSLLLNQKNPCPSSSYILVIWRSCS